MNIDNCDFIKKARMIVQDIADDTTDNANVSVVYSNCCYDHYYATFVDGTDNNRYYDVVYKKDEDSFFIDVYDRVYNTSESICVSGKDYDP